MGIVERKTDESFYWIKLLIEAGIMETKKLESLMKETTELLPLPLHLSKLEEKLNKIRNEVIVLHL
jgi:hypothetical protein